MSNSYSDDDSTRNSGTPRQSERTAASGDPSPGAQLNAELQAGARALESNTAQQRRLAARGTGELLRPSSASTGETVRPAPAYYKTGQQERPIHTDIGDAIRREKGVKAWQVFALSMLGLAMVAVCVYAAKQISVQTEAKRSYILGRNLLRDGKYSLAVEHFDKSLRHIPYNSDGYFYRGMAYAHSGQFESGLADFDKVLTFTPERVAAFNGKSLCNIKLKEYDKAVIAATVALKVDPKDTNALLLRSVANSKNGRLKEALTDCDTVIDIKPKKGLSSAYANRAFIYFKMGQVLAAIRDFRLAIDQAPNNAVLYSNLAQCLKRKGDTEGAINECKACLKLDPKDLPSLLLLGECYRQSKQPLEALKYLDRAVSLAPCADTYKLRAEAYMGSGNYKLAYNDLDRVIRARPQDADALKKRQICHGAVLKTEGVAALKKLEAGQTPTAVTTAAPPSNVKLARTFPELLQQGYSLLQSGSASTAVQALKQAIAMDPRHALARRYLAYALFQNGESADAAQQFAVLGRLQRLDNHDLTTYGKALVAAGNYADAVKVYKVLLQANPNSFEARTALIQSYIGAGQSQQATSLASASLQQARSESERSTYSALLKASQKTVGAED